MAGVPAVDRGRGVAGASGLAGSYHTCSAGTETSSRSG